MLEPIQGKCARTYSIASHKPHELRLLESHKVLRTHSQELGVEVELWHHHPNMKRCHLCDEKLVKDDSYHLLIRC